MLSLCTLCDISGAERKIGTGYALEQCQNECLEDTTCLGIDFGENGGRSGECYFNFDQNEKFQQHTNFKAWSKNPNCGRFYFT